MGRVREGRHHLIGTSSGVILDESNCRATGTVFKQQKLPSERVESILFFVRLSHCKHSDTFSTEDTHRQCTSTAQLEIKFPIINIDFSSHFSAPTQNTEVVFSTSFFESSQKRGWGLRWAGMLWGE